MADTKISAMTAAGSLAGTEVVPVLQGGANKKTTAQAIANLKVEHFELQVAASDETTPITTGAAKVTFRAPRAFTITGARASLSTAGSTASAVDVNLNGVSIFSTVLTIDSSERTTTTAATPAVIGTSAAADDDEFTVDIDTAGTDAAGLKVTLIGTVP